MHNVKYSATYEVTFCIGSREGYHGREFTRDEVLEQINKFQREFPKSMPVKVSDRVTFTMQDYREDGWEVSAICYPNGKLNCNEINEFMAALAENLLYCFKQNRITIRSTYNPSDYSGEHWPRLYTVMLEIEGAEVSHK